MAYDWPLNVRELAQALGAIAVFATDGRMRLARAPEAVRSAKFEPPLRAAVPSSPREGDAELRKALLQSLERHGGNVSQVAREMGRTRMQIHRWMRRFAVDPASYRK
jgi:transcriptional regulator of acetoin/glycerol metabolism